MARGFESKSAQSAAEDAEASRETRSKRETRSSVEIERDWKRESLELSRRRIQHELEVTQSDLRKRSLEAALAHLDGEIAKLA